MACEEAKLVLQSAQARGKGITLVALELRILLLDVGGSNRGVQLATGEKLDQELTILGSGLPSLVLVGAGATAVNALGHGEVF